MNFKIGGKYEIHSEYPGKDILKTFLPVIRALEIALPYSAEEEEELKASPCSKLRKENN